MNPRQIKLVNTSTNNRMCKFLVHIHKFNSETLSYFSPLSNKLRQSNRSWSTSRLLSWWNRLFIIFFDPNSWNPNQSLRPNWLNCFRTVSKNLINIKIDWFYIEIVCLSLLSNIMKMVIIRLTFIQHAPGFILISVSLQ